MQFVFQTMAVRIPEAPHDPAWPRAVSLQPFSARTATGSSDTDDAHAGTVDELFEGMWCDLRLPAASQHRPATIPALPPAAAPPSAPLETKGTAFSMTTAAGVP